MFAEYDGERKRGRPLKHSSRRILESVLFILYTGAPWRVMPRDYPPYQTVHKRFQKWVKDGLLMRVLQRIAQDLKDRGKLDLNECYIDATFLPAKKGGSVLVKQNGERVPNSWQSRTALVFLSPSMLHLLHLMRYDSSKIRLEDYLLKDPLEDSLEIELMTVIR